ncbi:nitrous oxide-stimulated promoter family protein [Anaerolentibacter hominis]|uniref:nitrous oxide-stimulated promoter family protein n=1 Tax=Anaerolentibacter hominis TaxID=3079009 RepID=UPI0031B89DFB
MRKSQPVSEKRLREQKMVSEMIALYCRKKHGNRKELCQECSGLEEYALLRSEHCPFMETKTFCSNCKVHCYKPEMREKIRRVMRFSGPRMLFRHPVMAVRHMLESKAELSMIKKKRKDLIE